MEVGMAGLKRGGRPPSISPYIDVLIAAIPRRPRKQAITRPGLPTLLRKHIFMWNYIFVLLTKNLLLFDKFTYFVISRRKCWHLLHLLKPGMKGPDNHIGNFLCLACTITPNNSYTFCVKVFSIFSCFSRHPETMHFISTLTHFIFTLFHSALT